jgi:hypothetical protein
LFDHVDDSCQAFLPLLEQHLLQSGVIQRRRDRSLTVSEVLDVCLNQRIASHKVFAGLASSGMTSTGWFFGFKLHLIINDRGELLNVLLTPGNVGDRKPVPKPVRKLFGKLFGGKGYISHSLYEQLL